MRRVLALLVGITVVAVTLLAQTPERPSFEVTSVKRNTSGESGQQNRMTPTQLFYGNAPVRMLLSVAYNMPMERVIGGPEWIKTDRFDVMGTVPAGANRTDLAPAQRFDQITRPMIQRLLEERFSLRAHRDTKELPVYVLVRADPNGRLGPGLRASTVDCPQRDPGQPPPKGHCTARITQNSIDAVGYDWSLLNLAQVLQPLDRPVMDKTGLTGRFDIKMEWALDGQAGTADRVSVFTALREQLGLKLDSTTAPVEVLVIDSVSQPTPD